MTNNLPLPSCTSHSHLGSHRRLSKGAVGGEAGVGASGGFAQAGNHNLPVSSTWALCGHRQQGLALLPPSVNDSQSLTDSWPRLMAVIMVSPAGSFNTTRETVLMRKRNQGVVSGAISPSAAFLLQAHNPC